MPQAQNTPAPVLWTADGYIQDQDALTDRTYRTISAHYNGCGPVAVFDLRHHMGHDVRFDDVLREMDEMHIFRAPGPTMMYVMRRYLRKYLPGWREVHGREAALAAAEGSSMGILRYHEEHVPHFVPFFRVGDGRYRFLNVSDDTEDGVFDLPAFWEGHLRGGSVKLFCWQ